MQTEKFYFQVTVSSLRHVSTHFLKVKTLNRCSQGSFAARKDGLNISRFVYQCEAEWWLIRWRLQILFMSCASAKVNNMWYRFQEFVVSPTANSCNCRITRLEEKKKESRSTVMASFLVVHTQLYKTCFSCLVIPTCGWSPPWCSQVTLVVSINVPCGCSDAKLAPPLQLVLNASWKLGCFTVLLPGLYKLSDKSLLCWPSTPVRQWTTPLKMTAEALKWLSLLG